MGYALIFNQPGENWEYGPITLSVTFKGIW